ncbi:hypothetical protein RCL1_002879 [Eukaryota sp. TZLM3-RCL]
MPEFHHNVLDFLLYAQSMSLHTDFEINFNQERLPCHKAIVSQFSERLSSLIQNNQDSHEVDEYVEASYGGLLSLVQCFYGKTLAITSENALSLFLLAKSLSCSDLTSLCKSFLGTFKESEYQTPVSTILENLLNDNFKDHQIIFHGQSLHIHKFLFVAISPYFKAKFSRNWQESEENTTDFTKLLQVSPSSFINFFTSFYNGKLEVNLENAFDFSHLAWYFQLSELEKFVNNFIENSESEYNWVTSLVSKAITSEDYRLIKIISPKISEIPDLSNCDPIPVHPLFFENLTSNIDVAWLLRCLVFSYTNYSEENLWTPKSLEKSFEQVKIETLPIKTIYQIIEPLFSISDLFDFLSSFSLSIFSKFTSQVPINWLTWFIVECDKRKEFNLISQVSPLLNEIITPENIDQVPITSFNSETLNLFAINSKKEHLVIWMINCLIELWPTSQLNVKEFSRILMGFDLSETRFELVYSTLAKLFSDEILRPILFEFVSIKLVPRLLKDSHDKFMSISVEIEQQNNELKELKKFNEEQNNELKEQNKVIEQLQKVLQLPIIQQALQQEEEAREIKLKQEREAKEAEQKRLTELAKQQALEAQLNQEFINKGGVKFLASNKGSNLTLSENDLLVTKTGGNQGHWDNSFVQINHPVKGKVVLTLTNFDSDCDFDTRIGLFDPSYCQASDCYNYAHALYVNSCCTQFRVNNSNTGPSNPGGISVGQQIVIDFNNDQVTFSVPSLGYSYTVTWPSGYVFGLAMCYQSTSWQISSS